MPSVHPTAVIEGPVELAADVVVGPLCVLHARAGAAIAVGAGTRLVGRCWLEGPLVLGERNTVYPEAALGLPPQDLKWNPDEPGAGVVVGSGNVFREGATINRATSRDTPTRIGDRNYFMANSHAGHDCRIGSDCIFANSCLFGGHVQVADRVVIGGNTSIHQFVRIGRLCMVSGNAGTSLDLPPFMTLTAINIAGSINLVGMRRAGHSREDIDDVRWAYQVMYRSGTSPRRAAELLAPRGDRPCIREMIEFLESAKRSICHGRGRSTRGTAQARVGTMELRESVEP